MLKLQPNQSFLRRELPGPGGLSFPSSRGEHPGGGLWGQSLLGSLEIHMPPAIRLTGHCLCNEGYNVGYNTHVVGLE